MTPNLKQMQCACGCGRILHVDSETIYAIDATCQLAGRAIRRPEQTALQLSTAEGEGN